jgi:hypothetical protein
MKIVLAAAGGAAAVGAAPLEDDARSAAQAASASRHKESRPMRLASTSGAFDRVTKGLLLHVSGRAGALPEGYDRRYRNAPRR